MATSTPAGGAEGPSSNWRFRQVFGDRDSSDDPADEDLISAVEFSPSGDYLATGDRGGRVVLFESSEVAQRREGAMAVDPSTSTGDGDGDGSPSAAAAREIEYRFYCEFQSHDPEFDYLKSLEIEERINKIRWCRARTGPLFLLSTNDKTIKLWKVHEKSGRVVTSRNVDPSQPAAAQRAPFLSGPSAVVMPTLQPMQPMVTATLKRTYGNGHAYHINSLSFNADGETYLSADDLRIHIWNLNTAQQAYNIADLKPADMEELSEVIMAAEFHPTDCAALAYCSSKGVLRLADLRERALCDAKGGCRTFRPQADAEASSFFSEVVSSMTDVKFSRDGRRLMTRDYMTVKVWDVAMEREPLRTIKVHEHLRSKLTDLYENDHIFDKFEATWSADGRSVCSGSYDSKLHIWDVSGPDGVDAGTPDPITLEATTASPRRSAFKGWGGAARKDSLSVNFNKKVLHHSYHPQRDVVAIGAQNSLYIFSSTPDRPPPTATA